jgi:hypothetical protein
MFNHPSDAVLIAHQDPNFEFFLDVVLGDTGAVTTTPIPHQVGGTILSMAMGNFTGDGFADLVISYGTLGTGGTGAVRIGTAGDVNNLASNVTFGPEQTTGVQFLPWRSATSMETGSRRSPGSFSGRPAARSASTW